MKRIIYAESLGLLDHNSSGLLIGQLGALSQHTDRAVNKAFAHGFAVIAEFESPVPTSDVELDEQMRELIARPAEQAPIELGGRQRPIGTKLVRLILEPR